MPFLSLMSVKSTPECPALFRIYAEDEVLIALFEAEDCVEPTVAGAFRRIVDFDNDWSMI